MGNAFAAKKNVMKREDVCAAKHWQGFINCEKETVKVITDWIKSPQSQVAPLQTLLPQFPDSPLDRSWINRL